MRSFLDLLLFMDQRPASDYILWHQYEKKVYTSHRKDLSLGLFAFYKVCRFLSGWVPCAGLTFIAFSLSLYHPKMMQLPAMHNLHQLSVLVHAVNGSFMGAPYKVQTQAQISWYHTLKSETILSNSPCREVLYNI